MPNLFEMVAKGDSNPGSLDNNSTAELPRSTLSRRALDLERAYMCSHRKRPSSCNVRTQFML